MGIKERLYNTLFLDIETAALAPSFDKLEEGLSAQWIRKSRRFIQLHDYPPSEEEVSALYHEKASIFAEFSKVVCVSVGIIRAVDGQDQLRVRTIYHADERVLLLELADLLNSHFYDRYNHFICGHNIREFDIPFLCRRMIINDITLPNLFRISGMRAWQITHLLDTMDLWKFGDFKHFTSLELLCKSLQIPSPKSKMSGDMVSEAYWNNRIEDIKKYWEKDLVSTVRVFQKLSGLPAQNDDQIVFVD